MSSRKTRFIHSIRMGLAYVPRKGNGRKRSRGWEGGEERGHRGYKIS
jgi:hypothetical protein